MASTTYPDHDRCEVVNKKQFVLSRKRCSGKAYQTRWVGGRAANVCKRHARWIDDWYQVFEVCDGTEE